MDAENRKAPRDAVLGRVQRAVAKIRTLDPDMPAATLEVLLIIARNPDISMTEILNRMEDTSMSAVSRHVSMLTQWRWNRKAGMGLVEWREDPYERRRKLCRLTRQGEKFVAELAEVAGAA